MFNITDDVKYIGVDDKTIDLFEGQYAVPNGVSYNSYVITDGKIAVMDTVDKRKTDEWFNNLKAALGGNTPDYLIITHMEPDHSAGIKAFFEAYPNATAVGNDKTFNMLARFYGGAVKNKLTIKDGETLSLGKHTLKFVFAPMVHWPEVMFAYDTEDKILFSADAFGKFGALDTDEDWTCEARRYYFNIVGKYGATVQAALKKAAALDIKTICPLHGPILTEDLGYYIGKYDIWSSYRAENEGVMIAYASVYGNTENAVFTLKEKLEARGLKVAISDLARDDGAEAVEDAFRYDRLVVACPTIDGGLFPAAESFISHLKSKNYQNRKVAFIENGSWAPVAAKLMRAAFEGLKNIAFAENGVTVNSAVTEETLKQIDALAAELAR